MQDSLNLKLFKGGVFEDPIEEDDSILTDEEAFRFAVDFANRELAAYNVKYSAITHETEGGISGPFQAKIKTCSLVNQQAMVIFGPKNEEDIDIVQAICDYKDLAHVITRWVWDPTDFRSIINFYPHSSYLTLAYFSILRTWEWKSFTLFYEDNESILRLGDLLNLAKNEGIIVTVKQLYEGIEEEPIYRYR